MTPSALLLWGLLQSVGAAVTSQCRQGATFSEAVLSPALSSSDSVLWVPGVASLARCLVSCCDLPRCDLAWLFQRRCYLVVCQQGETCRPQDLSRADSYLAFVRRGPPQTLVLGSLVRGEPYDGGGGRWRSAVSEAPGDTQALKDLVVLQGVKGPRNMGGGGGERGGGGGRGLEEGLFPHWSKEEGDGREAGLLAFNGSWDEPSSPGGPLGEQSPTFHPAENRETSPPFTFVVPSPWKPTTSSTLPSRPSTSLPTEEAASRLSDIKVMLTTAAGLPLQVSPAGDHVETMGQVDADHIEASISPATQAVPVVRQSPRAVVDPSSQVLSPPVKDVVLNASDSQGDGMLSFEWQQIGGPSVTTETSADTMSLHLALLDTGNYTFRLTVTDSTGSSDSTTATVLVVPPDARPVPAEIPPPAPPSTSDPTDTPPPRPTAGLPTPAPTPIPLTTNPTTVAGPASGSPALPVGGGPMKRRPVAVVGPDQRIVLPVSSVTLDGSASRDDRALEHFHWDATSGPPGLKMEGVDRAVATATGLRVGRYTFTLTVSNQQGATDSAVLTVRVEEARVLPPMAHASGSHTLTLPNNSLVLRGSLTDGDQTQIHFLWVRDSQSPAAGDVLYGSQTTAWLYLTNLVEGTYLFQLRVTDAQGRGSVATATVEVRPDTAAQQEVDVEVLVGVAQVSVAQRDTVVRQLAALLHVLDNNIQLRILPGHSHFSAVLRMSVWGPGGSLPGSRLVQVLRNQLLREKTDYLLFRVIRVDTVFCLLRCSGRGQCDPITKDCVCDSFWMENLVRRFLGDGERNCEWRVLYVIMSSFLSVVLILGICWSVVCCCRRRKRGKVRKKTKYTILDDMDDQERKELRPKHGIKHRSTEHASSLMMSESELDSEQDTVFSRDRAPRCRGHALLAQAARNGNAFV